MRFQRRTPERKRGRWRYDCPAHRQRVQCQRNVVGKAMIVGYWPATFILGGLFFAAMAYMLWRVKRR